MPAATLTRWLRRALGKEGIMYATLSPPWKKSLLLVFVSVVAFVTATPATSGPQCFFQGLGFLPGGSFSFARGVNADGTVVVGPSNDASGHSQAFRGVNGSMTGLGFLPGGNGSSANGVNADGTVVVGSSNDASGHGQAFRWTAERGMVGLDFLPGGNRSSATGVNADGTVVVGTADDASGQPQAFRWTAETRVQSVLTLLQAAKADVNLFAGWQLRSANRVSADGTVIVGDGVDPLGLRQGWIARLPKEDNEDCEEDENEDELEGRDQRD